VYILDKQENFPKWNHLSSYKAVNILEKNMFSWFVPIKRY